MIKTLLPLFLKLLPLLLLWVLVVLFKKLLMPRLKGRIGEGFINNRIKTSLDPNIYHLIPDIMLPTPNGTTQTDHVIVSRYGIFVIETKSYTGWIYGGENDPQWIQLIYKRKEKFQNPLRQNYKHIKTLSDLTGIPREYFKSLVVFTGDCEFKTEMPPNVTYIGDFIKYIKSHRDYIIKDSQVMEVVDTIRQWAGTVSEKQKHDHVHNLHFDHAPVSADSAPPACPRCGKTMVLRTSRKNNSQFWGCIGYPDCRGTRKTT